jgi:hypothetical protein
MSEVQFEAFALTQAEQEVIACYEQLRTTLLERRDQLPPYAERNAIKALAALWQVANGAGLQPGQVYDAGA